MARTHRTCRSCADPTDAVGGRCTTCGSDVGIGPGDPDRVAVDLGVLAGVSDRGLVRGRNEDAMALGPADPERARELAAVLCDGVATGESGDRAAAVASSRALDTLLDGAPTSPCGPTGSPLGAMERMRRAVAAAAAAVAPLASPRTRVFPACTLVSALVDRSVDGIRRITVGWVGDSRAYWLAAPDAAEPSRLLTADHARGDGITRWLGVDPPDLVEAAGVGEPHEDPDVVTLTPSGPGAVLLCSDGLWGYRPSPAALAALVMPALPGAGGPLAAATALTGLALRAGGRDNITAVVIPVP